MTINNEIISKKTNKYDNKGLINDLEIAKLIIIRHSAIIGGVNKLSCKDINSILKELNLKTSIDLSILIDDKLEICYILKIAKISENKIIFAEELLLFLEKQNLISEDLMNEGF